MKHAIFIAAIAASLAGYTAPALPGRALCPVPGAAASKFAPEGENVTEARPLVVRVTRNGGLSFPGGDIDISAFRPGWTGIPIKADWQSAETGERVFEIRETDGTTLFRGHGSWSEAPGGALDGVIEIECLAEVRVQCLAVDVAIPEEPPFGLGDGSSASYDLPAHDGRVLHVEFAQPVAYHSQDSRPWGERWSVRFGEAINPRTFAPGDRLVWKMRVSSPDGIALASSKPVTIECGDTWIPLEYRKDPVPGSALDLSGTQFAIITCTHFRRARFFDAARLPNTVHPHKIGGMNTMSRISIKEYILRKRDDYLGETPRGKSKMLDEMCRTVGMTRKYVIKLLSGNIEYRERKGRGKTYDGKTLEAMKKVWHEAGCPCCPISRRRLGCGLTNTTHTSRSFRIPPSPFCCG